MGCDWICSRIHFAGSQSKMAPPLALHSASAIPQAAREDDRWVFRVMIMKTFVEVQAIQFDDKDQIIVEVPIMRRPEEARARAEVALLAAIKDSATKV
jgi:hypothetical protein